MYIIYIINNILINIMYYMPINSCDIFLLFFKLFSVIPVNTQVL